MHSGHIKVENESDGHLFFWLVESQHNLPKNKLVIWLNGGPGCSSMDGMFLENGPFRVSNDGKSLEVNEYSWWHNANLLYDHFINFLNKFFDVFPQHRRSELYMAGESFAGIYIPYIVHEILRRNKGGLQTPSIRIKGIAIGNGWLDPVRQYQAYIDFGVERKLLSGRFLTGATSTWKSCEKLLQNAERIKYDTCEMILNFVLDESRDGGKGCINMYDIRLRDDGPNDGCGAVKWPFGLDNVKKYLGRPDVVRAIHATGKQGDWLECDDSVSMALDHDTSPPSYTLLPDILAEISVVLFSGDMDLICNHIGTERMIENLEWNGKKGFGKENQKMDWYIDGQLSGSIQTSRNLTFALVHNASHMVPIDAPKAALDIFHRLIGVEDIVVSKLQESGTKALEKATASKTPTATSLGGNSTNVSEPASGGSAA
ncbi:Cell death protease [Quaeritorhiza haematococci]|nr:Cell death protease [Quaeritorhiza haematococci]